MADVVREFSVGMATMSTLSLERQAERALEVNVGWDGMLTARLISSEDLTNMRRLSGRSVEAAAEMLGEEGGQAEAYCASMLAVLKNVSREEAVNYVLSLIFMMLKEDSGIAARFHGAAISDPYTPLLRLLQRQNSFAQELAALALAAIVAARPDRSAMAAAQGGDEEDEDSISLAAGNGGAAGMGSSAAAVIQIVLSFIDWICGQLRKPAEQPPESVVHALAVLLYERSVRPAVVRGAYFSNAYVRIFVRARVHEQKRERMSVRVLKTLGDLCAFLRPDSETTTPIHTHIYIYECV